MQFFRGFIGGIMGIDCFLCGLDLPDGMERIPMGCLVSISRAHFKAGSFFRLEPWSFPFGRMLLFGAEMAS